MSCGAWANCSIICTNCSIICGAICHCFTWQIFLHMTNLRCFDTIRHWQESQSRKIWRRNDSIFSRSLEKIGFSFLFLFSIFKIFRKNFYFSSRFMRFFNPFSFSFQFSRCLRKNSLSLLHWWDSETQISLSSRFSRFWEKISFSSQFLRFLKTRFFRNKYLTSLNFWDFFLVSIPLRDG